MVYHYLFYDLLCKRPELQALYLKMPFSSADKPCGLQRYGLDRQFDAAARTILDDDEVPLHKLTWKAKGASVQPDSIINHLIRSKISQMSNVWAELQSGTPE